MERKGCFIAENDTLIVRSYDDKSSYILQVNGEKKINKSRVSLKEIVGEPYGAVFELNNRKFKRISETEQCEVEQYDPDAVTEAFDVASSSVEDALGSGVTAVENSGTTVIKGDNSTYVDTNTAQKLTPADILKLKESGTSAQDIIKQLIDNSDTFAAKTEYAQMKWIKKKENKYRRRYKIIRSNPMNVCEASYDKNKEKICNLRFDSLAQILSQAGIHSGRSL
jgi:tRNA (adenine58-N1)-methyltransferase non-catalytic subunit